MEISVVLGVLPGWPSRTSVYGGVTSFNHELRRTQMTETNNTLIDLLQKHDEGDFCAS